MIRFVSLSGQAGSIQVYYARALSVSDGLVDFEVRPRYGSAVEVTMTPAECRELADVLNEVAEEAERA